MLGLLVKLFNRLTMEFIFGCDHPECGIESVFLSNNGGHLQNVAMALK